MVPLAPTDPVRRAVRDFASGRPADERWVIGVSGGADSLALAAACLAERETSTLVAVTVDHGLQDGSDRQARWCRELLQRWGCADARIVRVDVGRAGGLEAAARAARRTALEQIAAGSPILLAHTLDDQAETVLLGLGRGSGSRAISGMRVWRAPYARPLLTVRRTDTENACAALAVTPWADPHNEDSRFARVRLRREVLPLLEHVLGPGVRAALARTAEQLDEDLAALDEWADREASDRRRENALDIAGLTALPVAIRRRVVRRWLLSLGHTVTAEHLAAADELACRPASGRRVRLPGAVDVAADGTLLFVSPIDN